MKIRTVIIALGWIILQASLITGGAEVKGSSEENTSARKTPNVILIYADDLGRGLLLIEGLEKVTVTAKSI